MTGRTVANDAQVAAEPLAEGVFDPPPPYGLELLEAVARAGDAELPSAVSTYPGLISARLLRRLRSEAGQAPMLKRRRLVKAAEKLEALGAWLDTERERYPLGAGPVEAAAARVGAREVDLERATEQLRAPEIRVAITPVYVWSLMRRAIAEAEGDAWRDGLTLARLTVAAADAAGTMGERGSARTEAALNFLLVALNVVRRVPDGRVLGEALALGERAVGEAEPVGDRVSIGEAEYRLGSLLLDPAVAADTTEQGRIDERWRQILLDEYGTSFVFHDDDYRMPPLAEAVSRAEQHYRRAIEHRDGHARGMAEKALLQTLVWQRTLGVDVDEAEFRAIGHSALEHLDARVDPQHRISVANMLGERPPEAADGDGRALLLEAMGLREHDPEHGLALLERAASALVAAGDEDGLRQAARVFVELCAAWAPGVGEDTEDVVLRRAAQEGWPAHRTAAALVIATSRYGADDREREGLALLERVADVGPAFAAAHADVLHMHAAMLWMDAGSSARSAGDVPATVECYTEGLSHFLELGMRRDATTAIRRIVDMLQTGDPDAAVTAVAGLAPLVEDIDRLVDQASELDMQLAIKLTIAALFGSDYGVDATLIAQQMGKGHRFGAMLQSERDGEPLDDDARTLLALIAESEADVAGDSPERLAGEDGTFVQDERLLAYVGAEEALPGATAWEILENRRRAFDQRLNRALVDRRAAGRYVMSDAVQEALDERTVLLDLYLGMSAEAELCVYVHVFTRERVVRVAIPWVGNPDAEVYLEDGGRRLHMHGLALVIAGLRQELIADPGFDGNVSVEAAERLQRDVDGYIGADLYELLEEERSHGRDHLCFVPHGPLHYHPLHLIGPPEHPLAQDFAISFLPNLHLLTAPRARRRAPTEAAAIGMTFTRANPYGMPLLPHAADEARAIAGIYGVAPLIDDAATEEAVLGALANAGTVHLHTHGTHDIAAPAFQCVYVTPGADSDGRVSAHELLGVDMAGLDLVTLSACETALGRFDRGDNLRGLPGSLLLAGASTVVGTLWEVGAEASAHFFRVLHTERRSGTGKLDAFWRAQRDTRSAFPAYRDWGAFQLVGDHR